METERLFLRPYQSGDGVLYYQIGQRNKKHLEKFESGNILMQIESEEEGERAIQRLIASWDTGEAFFLGAFQKETGNFVAQIYIGLSNRRLPEYELGYIVDVDHEGKGYVTEAAGAALHFEPGTTSRVELTPIGGARVIVGFAGLVDGPLDAPGAADRALEKARACGYLGAEATA